MKPIEPNDRQSLIPVGIFNHVEFLIRDQQGSDGSAMRNLYNEKLNAAKLKYRDATCEVVGDVEKLKL